MRCCEVRKWRAGNGVADPAAVEGNEATRENAFYEAYHQLDQRIRLLAGLKLEELADRT